MISDGAAEAIKEDDAMSVFFMDFDMAPSVIWARDLYDQMQIRSDFRKWFPRMCQYGFVEGRDYEFVPRVRPQDEGGRTVQRYVKDYRITLEMAKQLYKLHHFHKNDCFRSCEGQHCMGTDHWMQAVIELLHQHKCKSHAPPKRFYESQPPDSLVTTTQIAKEYGCGAKVFNRLLHLHGIQYRANNQWVLYMQKTEQKTEQQAGLGMSFCEEEGRITVFRKTLEALEWPSHYRFLYNRKMKQIAVQACGAEESGAHRVGKPDESNSGEIKCMALVRMIYGDSGWDKKMSYRLIGRAFPQQRLVSFKITDAMQIENGRVLTEM